MNINPIVDQQTAIAIDSRLESEFLTDQLGTVALAAQASGSAALWAVAAFPLKRRIEELRVWRAGEFLRCVQKVPYWGRWLQSLSPEQQSKVRGGEVPLAEVADAAFEYDRGVNASARAAKGAALASIKDGYRGSSVDSPNVGWPKAVVIFPDGKTEFYRVLSNAHRAARDSAAGGIVVQLSPKFVVVLPPAFTGDPYELELTDESAE